MSALRSAHRAHPRTLGANRYVYAVLSRRAGGISIGVNLSPHKRCNFDCTYCQVDRTTPGPEKTVDLAVLREELRDTFASAASGELARRPRFADAPAGERRVVDVALSGDGEPTNERWFPEAARIVAEEKERAGFRALPYRILTNATVLHKPKVAQTLRFLDAHGLDVWTKFDAGTERYYRLVDRSRVPFARVFENIVACARERPVTIQALFARHHGAAPTSGEIENWAARLAKIVETGGRIGWVQVHSIARPPAEGFVAPLTLAEVEAIADVARAALPGVRVEAYRGAAD